MLRDYQQKAIDMLYDWFDKNDEGNPCLVLPTGSGKSHIIAAMIKDMLNKWQGTRVLMLTHVKELIEQNAEKMREHWKNAPMGIYSASLNKRCLTEPITFAGIQSIVRRAKLLGHIDIVIVDECFVSGTKIMTPNGEKDIELLRCGDIVYNAGGVGEVLSVSAKPADETYLLEFSDGKSIECTPNHLFFTDQGWQQARELEVGAHFFGIEGLRLLWETVESLDQKGFRGENNFGNARANMERAAMLLSVLCKEIEKSDEQSSITNQNESEIKRDSAQAYQAWRERAIAAIGTISTTSCFGRGLGIGICDSDKNETSWDRLSNLLQAGLGKPVNENRNRIGRRFSRIIRKESARFEENRFSDFPRLERISVIKRTSSQSVFNLHISGHPSFFANGKLVHNCHSINHKDAGSYRKLIETLKQTNPNVRVVGLTASPFRSGHGMIHEGDDVIFNALIEPVQIETLVDRGFLSPLRSKHTDFKIDVNNVKKRGGEFVAGELERAVDTQNNNEKAVKETIIRAADRKSWLVFCTGVDHARHMSELFNEHGIAADCVTGETPQSERDAIIKRFKSGELRVLTNMNVLTTGFDYPGIDCLVMLRPTLSPGLYLQMAGRGMRTAPGKDDCLVLDFAGNVRRHGPITAVEPPNKTTDAPKVKFCPQCDEIVSHKEQICPSCGFEFPQKQRPLPKPEKEELVLYNDDIMGKTPNEFKVSKWLWSRHISKTSGKEMLKITYYGSLSSEPITEYLPVMHENYAGEKARLRFALLAKNSGVYINNHENPDLHEIAKAMNTYGQPPSMIVYRREGKFFRVLRQFFDTTLETTQVAAA